MANDFATAIASSPEIGAAATAELSRPTNSEPAAPAATPTALPRASEPSGAASPAAKPAEAKPAGPGAAPVAGAPTPGTPGAAAPAIDPEVLAQARTQVETEFADVLGFAESVRSPEMQQTIALIRQMESDPVAFYKQYGQSLRMAGLLPADGAPAAGAGAPAPAAPAAAPFKMPEPAFVDPNGKAVYGADQVKEIIDNVRAEFQTAVKPLADERAAERAAHEEQELRTQIFDNQKSIVEDARKNWEGFKENEAAIIELLTAEAHLPPRARKFGANLEKAYLHVYRTQIRPDLENRIRQQVHTDLRTTAKSNTLRPGAPKAGAGGKREVRSTRDAIEQNPELVSQIIGKM